MTVKTFPRVVAIAILSAAVGFAVGASTDKGQALMIADEAFSRALAERNSDAFASWIDHDAIFLAEGEMANRDQVLDMWSVFLDRSTGQTMSWRPEMATVSKCDDMGYTIGEFEGRAATADGPVVTQAGRYISVWKRDADGAWRVVADVGSRSEN